MILAVSTSQATWYLSRGSGLVSLILLTLSMALGIAQFERWAGPTGQRFVVTHLHRNASLLAVVFLGVHIATTVLDGYAPINWLDALIPFASPYRTIWLGLGTLAFDLVLALVVTSLLRTRISYGAWKAVHWAAYLCWPVAFVHGLGTGSDGRVGWVQLVDLACLGLVLMALVWRLAVGWQHHAVGRGLAAAATVLLVLVSGAWAYQGPMQAGWARKAGTPQDLLPASGAAAAPDGGTAPGATVGLTPPFTAAVSGTVTQSGSAGQATVVLDGTLSGGAAGDLEVTIVGQAVSGGGVRMQSGTVAMGPADSPHQWSGPVTRLSGDALTATLQGTDGSSATASLQLAIPAGGSSFTGSVIVRTGA